MLGGVDVVACGTDVVGVGELVFGTDAAEVEEFEADTRAVPGHSTPPRKRVYTFPSWEQ